MLKKHGLNGNEKVLILKGLCLAGEKKYKAAIVRYDRVSSYEYKSAAASATALAYIELGQFDKAREKTDVIERNQGQQDAEWVRYRINQAEAKTKGMPEPVRSKALTNWSDEWLLDSVLNNRYVYWKGTL